MKEFHGYYLKVFNDKCEIYKDMTWIATADDEEKAKSYITKELESGNKTVKVILEFDYDSKEKLFNSYIWQLIYKIIEYTKCLSFEVKEDF